MVILMRRSLWATLAWLLCLAVLAGASAAQAAPDDAAEIRQVISTQFDKPDNPVVIDPVVVEDNDAIAGWTQGERGGRALLRRSEGKWRVVLCGGDALKGADALAPTGIAPKPAAVLAGKLAAAEKKLPPGRRALFSTFEGLMPMTSEGGEPHAGHHQ
jgi:hypothetical protein